MKTNREIKRAGQKFLKMLPTVMDTMDDLMRDPATPAPTKAQLIGYVLERAMGRPDATIFLETTGKGTIQSAQNRLIAIGDEVRQSMMSKPAGGETGSEADEDGYDEDEDTGNDCEEPEEDYEEDDEDEEEE